MTIYLIDKKTNEILDILTNVVSFTENCVDFNFDGRRGKRYCGENEIFTDQEPNTNEKKSN